MRGALGLAQLQDGEICCKPASYTAGILSLKNCNVFTGLDDGFKVSEHKQVTMS